MIFILISVVCLHLFTSAADEPIDPCQNYGSLINDKRSALYQPAPTESNICDEDLDESVWYRFQVLPPQRIHDECVQELHCGTEQPIWINGDHPTADDPGPKTVKVCSPLDDDCCGSWESTILVKFCPSAEEGDGDGFYVYRLKRVPHCDMAYCAGNSVVCTGESVWNPVRKECTEIIESVSASKVRYEKIAAFVGPGSIRNINEVRHDRGCQNPERWK